MKITFAILAATAALAGCATTYSYDNQRYSTREEMLTGADAALARAASTVSPLPQPLVPRTLTFAIPSESVLMKVSVAGFEQRTGRMIGMGEQVVMGNIMSANFRSMKALYDVVKRRNLFPTAKYLELDTASAELQASPTEDVLYYFEPRLGAGQWYYVTAKSGKQVFAFDRGGPTMEARTKAFIDAVQSFALRD